MNESWCARPGHFPAAVVESELKSAVVLMIRLAAYAIVSGVASIILVFRRRMRRVDTIIPRVQPAAA